MSVCICKKLSLLSHCTLIFSHFEKVWREWNDPEELQSMLILSLSLSPSLSFPLYPTPLSIGWRGIFDSCAVFSRRGITVAFQKELISQFVFWNASRSFIRSMTYFTCIITSLNCSVFLFYGLISR